MMICIFSYLAGLGTFVIVDMVWLSTMAKPLYRKTLGDILLQNVNIGPAIAFYAIYPLGLIIFVVLPVLNCSSFNSAIVDGALFGFFTYATYDLTNQVTLRNWTLKLTLIDVAWGSLVASLAAAAAYWAAAKIWDELTARSRSTMRWHEPLGTVDSGAAIRTSSLKLLQGRRSPHV